MFVAVALFKFSWLTVCIAVFASVSALVSCFFMPSESMIHFVRENGPVENLTLVFYVVAIAFILYSGRSFLTVRTRVAVTVLLAYMFMREASLHKSVSTMSILKSKFWLGSQIPWTDKLLAIAILAPVLWALFILWKSIFVNGGRISAARMGMLWVFSFFWPYWSFPKFSIAR